MTPETDNKYISVSYRLYAHMQGADPQMIEEATAENPFEFITGLGMTLDDFEKEILPLSEGAQFDFTLSVDQAYGEYDPQGRQEVPRSMFEIDGKLDSRYIYEGAVVPLQDGEGHRFNGLIALIQDDTVVVDLNHPLAGKALQFVGKVEQTRSATNQEIKDTLMALSGEGGCGGCGGCGDGERGSGCHGCSGGCGND
ncbi:MAG: peptidylprolyl isomerase [Bacteroidaceae bacterium]